MNKEEWEDWQKICPCFRRSVISLLDRKKRFWGYCKMTYGDDTLGDGVCSFTTCPFVLFHYGMKDE